MKTLIMTIVIFNINFMISQNQIDNSYYDKEVIRIKELLIDYNLNHKIEVIKLLKKAFKKVGCDKCGWRIDTSNIIFIPLLVFNDTTEFQNGEMVYNRINIKSSDSNLEGIVLYYDSDNTDNYMRINLVNEDYIPSWRKKHTYSNYNNKRTPANSGFSVVTNNYWIVGNKYPDLDKFTNIFRFYKNLTTFCLHEINSSDGYSVGGFDITPYFIFENLIYEEENLFFRDFNYEFNNINNLDSSLTNKHILENILKRKLYYKFNK